MRTTGRLAAEPPQRLTGMDTLFLAMESPTSQVHTLKLSILESAHAGQPLDAVVVREAIEQVVHAVPCYSQKLKPVPLGLHHPLLVGAGDFRLDDHVRHREVPPPGGPRERDRVIAEVCGSPLDRRHPCGRYGF